jgi:hypothetical protein
VIKVDSTSFIRGQFGIEQAGAVASSSHSCSLNYFVVDNVPLSEEERGEFEKLLSTPITIVSKKNPKESLSIVYSDFLNALKGILAPFRLDRLIFGSRTLPIWNPSFTSKSDFDTMICFEDQNDAGSLQIEGLDLFEFLKAAMSGVLVACRPELSPFEVEKLFSTKELAPMAPDGGSPVWAVKTFGKYIEIKAILDKRPDSKECYHFAGAVGLRDDGTCVVLPHPDFENPMQVYLKAIEAIKDRKLILINPKDGIGDISYAFRIARLLGRGMDFDDFAAAAQSLETAYTCIEKDYRKSFLSRLTSFYSDRNMSDLETFYFLLSLWTIVQKVQNPVKKKHFKDQIFRVMQGLLGGKSAYEGVEKKTVEFLRKNRGNEELLFSLLEGVLYLLSRRKESSYQAYDLTEMKGKAPLTSRNMLARGYLQDDCACPIAKSELILTQFYEAYKIALNSPQKKEYLSYLADCLSIHCDGNADSFYLAFVDILLSDELSKHLNMKSIRKELVKTCDLESYCIFLRKQFPGEAFPEFTLQDILEKVKASGGAQELFAEFDCLRSELKGWDGELARLKGAEFRFHLKRNCIESALKTITPEKNFSAISEDDLLVMIESEYFQSVSDFHLKKSILHRCSREGFLRAQKMLKDQIFSGTKYQDGRVEVLIVNTFEKNAEEHALKKVNEEFSSWLPEPFTYESTLEYLLQLDSVNVHVFNAFCNLWKVFYETRSIAEEELQSLRRFADKSSVFAPTLYKRLLPILFNKCRQLEDPAPFAKDIVYFYSQVILNNSFEIQTEDLIFLTKLLTPQFRRTVEKDVLEIILRKSIANEDLIINHFPIICVYFQELPIDRRECLKLGVVCKKWESSLEAEKFDPEWGEFLKALFHSKHPAKLNYLTIFFESVSDKRSSAEYSAEHVITPVLEEMIKHTVLEASAIPLVLDVSMWLTYHSSCSLENVFTRLETCLEEIKNTPSVFTLLEKAQTEIEKNVAQRIYAHFLTSNRNLSAKEREQAAKFFSENARAAFIDLCSTEEESQVLMHHLKELIKENPSGDSLFEEKLYQMATHQNSKECLCFLRDTFPSKAEYNLTLALALVTAKEKKDLADETVGAGAGAGVTRKPGKRKPMPKHLMRTLKQKRTPQEEHTIAFKLLKLTQEDVFLFLDCFALLNPSERSSFNPRTLFSIVEVLLECWDKNPSFTLSYLRLLTYLLGLDLSPEQERSLWICLKKLRDSEEQHCVKARTKRMLSQFKSSSESSRERLDAIYWLMKIEGKDLSEGKSFQELQELSTFCQAELHLNEAKKVQMILLNRCLMLKNEADFSLNEACKMVLDYLASVTLEQDAGLKESNKQLFVSYFPSFLENDFEQALTLYTIFVPNLEEDEKAHYEKELLQNPLKMSSEQRLKFMYQAIEHKEILNPSLLLQAFQTLLDSKPKELLKFAKDLKRCAPLEITLYWKMLALLASQGNLEAIELLAAEKGENLLLEGKEDRNLLLSMIDLFLKHEQVQSIAMSFCLLCLKQKELLYGSSPEEKREAYKLLLKIQIECARKCCILEKEFVVPISTLAFESEKAFLSFVDDLKNETDLFKTDEEEDLIEDLLFQWQQFYITNKACVKTPLDFSQFLSKRSCSLEFAAVLHRFLCKDENKRQIDDLEHLDLALKQLPSLGESATNPRGGVVEKALYIHAENQWLITFIILTEGTDLLHLHHMALGRYSCLCDKISTLKIENVLGDPRSTLYSSMLSFILRITQLGTKQETDQAFTLFKRLLMSKPTFYNTYLFFNFIKLLSGWNAKSISKEEIKNHGVELFYVIIRCQTNLVTLTIYKDVLGVWTNLFPAVARKLIKDGLLDRWLEGRLQSPDMNFQQVRSNFSLVEKQYKEMSLFKEGRFQDCGSYSCAVSQMFDKIFNELILDLPYDALKFLIAFADFLPYNDRFSYCRRLLIIYKSKPRDSLPHAKFFKLKVFAEFFCSMGKEALEKGDLELEVDIDRHHLEYSRLFLKATLSYHDFSQKLGDSLECLMMIQYHGAATRNGYKPSSLKGEGVACHYAGIQHKFNILLNTLSEKGIATIADSLQQIDDYVMCLQEIHEVDMVINKDAPDTGTYFLTLGMYREVFRLTRDLEVEGLHRKLVRYIARLFAVKIKAISIKVFIENPLLGSIGDNIGLVLKDIMDCSPLYGDLLGKEIDSVLKAPTSEFSAWFKRIKENKK